jgi:hypothetical protein
MTIFIKKLSVFCLVLLLVLGGVSLYKIHVQRTMDWRLPANVTTVFAGTCYAKMGVNPEYYPNSANFTNVAEGYLFTYLKLEKLLRANPQVDTLVLVFAPALVAPAADSLNYFRKSYAKWFLTDYAAFFGADEWRVFADHKWMAFTSLVSGFYRTIPRTLASYGGYEDTLRVLDRAHEKWQTPALTTGGHKVQSAYLQKIVSLADSLNLKVYLLDTPMSEHRAYNAYAYNCDSACFYGYYENHLKGIELLDYSSLQYPDSMMTDFSHLNHWGAIDFTKRLEQDIRGN